MTDGFYFYDFDNATGIVSNPRELNLPFTVNTSGSYGVAFSALSKKLYISSGGFDNTPKQFVDIETGEQINLFADNIKEHYKKAVEDYFNQLKLKCLQYKIDYVPVDINDGFEHILQSYLIKRKQFM